MGDLVNKFAWSATRAKALAECARLYWFLYYGSWGGWRAPPESPPAQLYLLKKLDTRWAWSGHVTHALIGEAVKKLLKGHDVSEAEQLERAHQTMRRDFKMSRDRAVSKAPAKKLRILAGQAFFGLLEHELRLEVPDSEWRAAWERTEAQLRWWHRSSWPDDLRAMAAVEPSPVLFTDDGNFEANRFAFDDTHVLSSPDFAFIGPEGDSVAVDWKGGKPRHEHVAQVTGYGAQLGERFGAPPERVRSLLVYLGRGEVEQQLDAARLDDWREKTRASIAAMRELLVDPAKNRPKPIEAFAMTRDEGKCRFCAFRRRCDRFDGTDAGDRPAEDVGLRLEAPATVDPMTPPEEYPPGHS